MIPRRVHFIYGLRMHDEPFHLLQYLAIESCRRLVAPDEIVMHIARLPFGAYWDMTRPLVTVSRIDFVDGLRTPTFQAGDYIYAHHSDVIRLDVLLAEGGMYADMDTIFVQAFPDSIWDHPAVIGEEADVQYDDLPAPVRSVSNAMLLAEPGSSYLRRWRDQIIDAMDGSWSNHACRLATSLADDFPDEVHVEPQPTFHAYDHHSWGMRALLEEPMVPGALDDALSVHQCAHLWWDPGRRDVSSFSHLDADEDFLASADTPLAVMARPFLPQHDLW